ncbi:histidine kinase [Rosettibacter firmus]|uniref:histidine kinase n=1 Tax=Rosettibacter firmus TaxID=3111522 RepID=UPI00336BD860
MQSKFKLHFPQSFRKLFPAFPEKFHFHYFLFTLLVIIESLLYLKGRYDSVYFPVLWEYGANGIVYNANKDSESYQLGFRQGDKIISLNKYTYQDLLIWTTLDNFSPGETINVEVLRGDKILVMPVILKSVLNKFAFFFIPYYMLIAFVTFIGIFVLYKKPTDNSAKRFFIFTHVFAFCLNETVFLNNSLYGIIRDAIFFLIFPFSGVVVIHFLLMFPSPNKIAKKFPYLIKIIYLATILLSLVGFFSHSLFLEQINSTNTQFVLRILSLDILWMSICLLFALFIAIYNFFTIKGTVEHNQYRWIMVGIILGLLPETAFGFVQDFFQSLNNETPYLRQTVWGLGTTIFLTSFSIAILKYKLWDIEIIIKRTLQYTVLTILVVGSYFIFFSLGELLFEAQSNTAKILSIIFSAILFIPVREVVQKKIDIIFHREPYDPTEAALNFESNLINNYNSPNLYGIIGQQIDNIFHFTNFKFFIRDNDDNYKTVFKISPDTGNLEKTNLHEKNSEMKTEIIKNPFIQDISSKDTFIISSKIEQFPEELKNIELLFLIRKVEMSEKRRNEIFGFFACGEKKSQRPFSRQDIELLKLLANRSSTIIQMSELYKAEIERREAIQKERERISKDMHDEIGSSLTQIAVLSELAIRNIDHKSSTEEIIKKISRVSRQVVDNISEIVWAINPKNDSLDNLAAYLREYASDLFESKGIHCIINFSDFNADIPLSSELKRNIFLAVKESFNNIIKHSNAENVYFNFSYDKNKINILIKDDGKGFDINNLKQKGNGLINIEKRIKECGGIVIINSEISVGTELKFELLLK